MDMMTLHTAQLGTTLYQEVKRGMLAALSAGEWKAGEAIPSEKRLGERFGVSIGTLRKAIDELVAENILIRHQGRGTFVAAHQRDRHYFRFFRVVRHDGAKSYPQVTLLAFAKARAPRDIAERLRLAPAARLFQFTNLLSLDGQPVAFDDISLPETFFAGLTEARLRERPSTLYSLYQDAFGLNIIHTDERVRAVPAGERHASLLGVAVGAPLLEIRRVAYSFNRQPVEWRLSYVDTARYEYLASES